MFARKPLHPNAFCVKEIDIVPVRVLHLPTTTDHLRTYCGTPL